MAFTKEALKEHLLLYAITDRSWTQLPEDAPDENKRFVLCEQVKLAIAGGASMVQMREKHLDDWAMVDEADALRSICNEAGIPFIINDNVAIAIASKADGVHLGQDDMNPRNARAVLGRGRILGVSVQTVEQALEAQAAGADYLGVGALFPTYSKCDAVDVSRETLIAIRNAVHIPVIGIGGITRENVSQLAGTGIDGVASISGIFGNADIIEGTKAFRAEVIAALR